MLAITYMGNRFDIIELPDMDTAYGYIAPAYGYRNFSTIIEISELFLGNKNLIINNKIVDYKKKAPLKIKGFTTAEVLATIEKMPDAFYIVIDIIKRDSKKTIVYLENIENTFFYEQSIPILRKIMINDILKDIC